MRAVAYHDQHTHELSQIAEIDGVDRIDPPPIAEAVALESTSSIPRRLDE